MTALATAFLVVAALAAAGDWIAVGRGDRRLERVCKPAATLSLVGVAASLDPVSSSVRALFVAALVAALAGDILLMVGRFLPGVAAFFVAQVLFAVGFVDRGGSLVGYVVGATVAVACAVPLARRFVHALRARGSGELVGPVIAYLSAVSVMVATALATGNPFAILGSLSFMASDSLIAEERFVAHRRAQPVQVMVTYHLALLALVLSLL